MQSIGQINGHHPEGRVVQSDVLPFNTHIGIELELEGPFPHNNIPGWNIHGDGSLRDGIEYVFRGPAAGDEAVKRINAMAEFIAKHDVEPTFRCSSHIHMDVSDLNIKELRRLVATYCVFEDVMFDHCELYRRFSNFCTPYFVNDNYLTIARNQFHNNVSQTGLFSNFPKYSAFNLQTVPRLGTVEFRGSHALVTADEMIGLAKRMMNLKRIVSEVKTEDDMEFINIINKMTAQDAFPHAIKERYTRDQETADICYSNAILLMTAPAGRNRAFIADDDVPQVRPIPNWQVPPADLRGRNELRGYNEPLLARIGILPPANRSWAEAKRLYNALRQMVGIGVNINNLFFTNDARELHDFIQFCNE